MTQDKRSAYETLYDVLRTVAVLGAPIAPFYMDRLYRDLTGQEDSVHFVLMPDADLSAIDAALDARMDLAQRATSMVLGLRKKSAIPVKQPLAKMLVPVISEAVRGQLEAVKDIVLGEVNVKEMEFIADTSGLVTLKIKPNFKTLGKVYGARMKEIAAAFGSLEQPVISAIQRAETAAEAYTLALPGGEVVLNPGDYQITSEDMQGWLVATEGKEGLSRELVNRIQNLRKASGFEVTDRIRAAVYASGEALTDLRDAVAAFGENVQAQTLALSLAVCPLEEAPEAAAQLDWEKDEVRIYVETIN